MRQLPQQTGMGVLTLPNGVTVPAMPRARRCCGVQNLRHFVIDLGLRVSPLSSTQCRLSCEQCATATVLCAAYSAVQLLRAQCTVQLLDQHVESAQFTRDKSHTRTHTKTVD